MAVLGGVLDELIDTQAWRYHDPRTFLVEKFATPPTPRPARSLRATARH